VAVPRLLGACCNAGRTSDHRGSLSIANKRNVIGLGAEHTPTLALPVPALLTVSWSVVREGQMVCPG
jgi:hypothetical protein